VTFQQQNVSERHHFVDGGENRLALHKIMDTREFRKTMGVGF